MFTEKQELQIEVTATNNIQVRTANIVLKDEVEISRTYHRACYSPIDDVSGLDQKIKDIASVVWTPEVIEKYRTDLAKAEIR